MKTFIPQDRQMNSLTVLKKKALPKTILGIRPRLFTYCFRQAGISREETAWLLEGETRKAWAGVSQSFLCGHAEEDLREGTILQMALCS